MVYRVYVEKKAELAHEANALKSDLKELLQIKGLENVRLLNRYDVENIEKDLFDYCIKTVFSDHSVFFCDSSFDSRMAYLCKISTVLGIYFKKQVQFFANCFKNEEKKTNSWLVLFYCLLNMLVSD